ncbi:hypothetical protein N8652_01000 [bacterium]|nr:hypothetical protein [bacterium]
MCGEDEGLFRFHAFVDARLNGILQMNLLLLQRFTRHMRCGPFPPDRDRFF